MTPRKLLLTGLLLLIILLPPFSIFFAAKTAEQLSEIVRLENEQTLIEIDFQNLNRIIDLSDQLKFEINIIKEDFLTDQQQFENKFADNKLEQYLEHNTARIKNRLGLPLEILAIHLTSDKISQLSFGDKLGLEQICSQFSTREFLAINNKVEQLKAQQDFKYKGDKFLRNFVADRKANNVISLSLRENDRIRMILFSRIKDSIALFALTELQNLDIYDSLALNFKELPPRNYGMAIIGSELSNQLFSPYFSDNPQLKTEVTELLGNLPDESGKIERAGHIFTISRADPRRNYRLVAAQPLAADNSITTTSSHFVILLLLFSCLVFYKTAHSVFFAHKVHLPLKAVLPITFIAVVTLPFFTAMYLAENYFFSQYASNLAQTRKRLQSELRDFDLDYYDRFREKIDFARGMNRLESIEKFTSAPFSENGNLTARKLLEASDSHFGERYFDSIRICTKAGELFGVRYEANEDIYKLEQEQNPALEALESRFSEILNDAQTQQGARNLSREQSMQEIGQGTRQEIIRDFFLHMLGPKHYYEFRRETLRPMIVKNDFQDDYLCPVVVFDNDIAHAMIAWHINSTISHKLVDQSDFKVSTASKRTAVFGTKRSYSIWPETLDDDLPEDGKLKQALLATYFSRSQHSERLASDKLTLIEAIAANYSTFAFAGSEAIPTYASVRTELRQKLFWYSLLILAIGLSLAISGALFFILPLKELTAATSAVGCANFDIKVQESHPDEFASIGKAFNMMTQGLKEGSVLKSFVSETIKRELADKPNGISETAELKTATIIFSSIKNFAAVTSSMSATEVVALMQQHLSVAVDALEGTEGEIDKMIEDKIMIVFEHNQGQSEQPMIEQAVDSAVKITTNMKEKYGLDTSIGINSGKTIAGIMGAEQARLSRTVIGDPVNLAARLNSEAMKLDQTAIVVSETIKNALSNRYNFVKLDVNKVKGKTQAVEVFKLVKEI